MTKLPVIPRELAENFTLMLAPFAPHIAEELWERPRPSQKPRAATLADVRPGEAGGVGRWSCPCSVNGKLRDKISVPADADEETILTTAAGAAGAKPWIEARASRSGCTCRRSWSISCG
jgi:leucyl-tRNA synthetase